MGVARVASEDKICSRAFHDVKAYDSGGSISNFIHERDRTSNYYDAVVRVSYAYVILEWSNELPKLSRYACSFYKAGSSICVQYDRIPI